jgi:hypothetical protein
MVLSPLAELLFPQFLLGLASRLYQLDITVPVLLFLEHWSVGVTTLMVNSVMVLSPPAQLLFQRL